jgi:TolB protein
VFDSIESGNWDLYVVDSQGGVPRQLTTEPSYDVVGTWSHDGKWIYFQSDREGERRIWKIPPQGGSAIQVTRRRGVYAVESWDAQSLYFTSLDGPPIRWGVWRVPVDGGQEAEVLPPGTLFEMFGMAVAREGLYYTTKDWGARAFTIQYLDFASGRVSEVFRREGAFDQSGLAVSPDERWVLFGERPSEQAELMLVENFR